MRYVLNLSPSGTTTFSMATIRLSGNSYLGTHSRSIGHQSQGEIIHDFRDEQSNVYGTLSQSHLGYHLLHDGEGLPR
jgi:hypothetical protein